MQVLKEFCGGKLSYKNHDLLKEFNDEHGYGFLLEFTDIYNDSINEIRVIKEVIETLTNWQKESWFNINKTTSYISLFDCDRLRKIKTPEKVTLLQARKMLIIALARHEALNSIFDSMKNTFESCADENLEKYFNIEE